MSKHSILEPTAQLRWFIKKPTIQELGRVRNPAPVLQQYWTDPLNRSGKGEWRDIPTVTETQQSVTEPPTLHN